MIEALLFLFQDVIVYEKPYEPPMTIEEHITKELGEDMLEVAKCESSLMHTKDGEIVRSHTNDVGIMQINEDVWLEEAEELSYDIYTLIGNIKMAKHIMNKAGKQSWVCYNKLYE